MEGTDSGMPASAPVALPARKRQGWRIASIVIAALLVVGALGYALMFYTPWGGSIRTAWSIATMPSVLKSATFISDGKDGSTLYQVKGLAFAKQPFSGMLISASDGLANQVVRDQSGYRYVVGSTNSAARIAPILGIAVTPGAAFTVISVPDSATSTLPFDPHLFAGLPLNANSWHLVAMPSSTTTPVHGPEGALPVAVDATHIVYISAAGIASWDISTGKVSYLLADPAFKEVPIAALVSPDHGYLGFRNIVAKTITIYRVSATSATKTMAVPTGSFNFYALGNDGLYALKRAGTSTEVWHQGFSETAPKRISVLPILINRLLIGSL